VENTYTSIDIGSDSIKVVVCQLFDNKLNLLAASSVKAEGVRFGELINKVQLKNSIKTAIDEVEEMLGINIDKVLLSVSSIDCEYTLVNSEIKLDNETAINGDDIENVLSSGANKIQTRDYEIINTIPIDFEVDNEHNIIDPKGKKGNILRSRSIIGLGKKAKLYPLLAILEEMGITVVDISLNSVGDICALKNKQADSEVGIIINIGYELTTVSLYNKSIPIKSKTIQIGSKNIDNDIAYVFKINTNEALKIKEKFALADKKFASKNDYFEVNNKLNEKIKISQYQVSEVVMSRIEEILGTAKKEINTLTNKNVDYIIITGGTSSMDNFPVVTEKIFGSIARVGNIKLLGVRNNKYSSAVGNIIFFINKLKLRNIDYTMIEEEQEYETEKSGIDSMLGKVFGYFFKED